MKNALSILLMIIVVGLAVPAHSSQIAYWRFDESGGTALYDQSGNGNDGVVHGAAWSNGIFGSALYFDGSNDYVEIQNQATFKFQQFTISCWIKPLNPYVSQDRVFFTNVQASSGISYGYTFRLRQNALNFCVARADGVDHWIEVSSPVFADTTRFHFAAASYDGSVMRIYFDSALVAEKTYGGGVEYSSVKPTIGASPSNSEAPGYFKGDIDEMRVFNNALTSNEIQALYRHKDTAVVDFLIPVSSPSLIRKPVLAWYAISDASYHLMVDTVQGFSKPIISLPVTDTFYKVIADLPIDTMYWKVTAAVNDTLRYFSNVGSFIIQDPRVPILISYIPKATTQRKLVFKWFSVEDASSYSIQIADNAVFTNALYTVPVSDTFFSCTAELPYGSVYWRVKSDLLDRWSALDKVTIQPDSIPILVLFDGGSVETKRPMFKWHPVKDAESYKIEIARSTSFIDAYSIPVTDTLYSPTADLSAGKYYWHVSCSRNPELFSIIDSLRIDPTGIDKDVSRPVQPVHLLIKSVKGNNRIIISIDKSNEINGVKFYSVSGRLISVVMRTEKTMRLEIPRVGKGIYFADIITNRRIFRSKIILP